MPFSTNSDKIFVIIGDDGETNETREQCFGFMGQKNQKIRKGKQMRTNFKRWILVAFTLTLAYSGRVCAEAANAPGEDALIEINSQIEYPRQGEYLDEYIYATVKAPGGHSVYGYGSADHQGTSYTVMNGERVRVIARRNDYSCVIVISEGKARWIRTEYLLEDGEEAVNQDIPSEKDLKEIKSGIEYPKADEYLQDYVYATVKAPKGHSVLGFGSADHQGSSYTVLDGEVVKVLAERKGYSCCIVLSQSKGRWINSEYLVPAAEFQAEDLADLRSGLNK